MTTQQKHGGVDAVVPGSGVRSWPGWRSVRSIRFSRWAETGFAEIRATSRPEPATSSKRTWGQRRPLQRVSRYTSRCKVITRKHKPIPREQSALLCRDELDDTRYILIYSAAIQSGVHREIPLVRQGSLLSRNLLIWPRSNVRPFRRKKTIRCNCRRPRDGPGIRTQCCAKPRDH